VSDQGATRVGASTRVFGVIGWPVSGSLSPSIHNAAFAALELDCVYVALPVPPGEMAAGVRGLRALGFAGANVTMPHKAEAAQLADRLSDDAARLDAANTLDIAPTGLVGHNTDAPGFERFLRLDAGFDAAGKRALVYGAGGAARACALALVWAGVAHVDVAVRDPGRAGPLAAILDAASVGHRALTLGDEAAVAALEPDLVVNATPVGATGETLPVPRLSASTLVVDLLYRPAATPLLVAAREAGAAAFGGLGLLLHQAALSFQIWTGLEPPMPVMSAAAMADLGRTPADPEPA
jgi:shikimate dehydrogenase